MSFIWQVRHCPAEDCPDTAVVTIDRSGLIDLRIGSVSDLQRPEILLTRRQAEELSRALRAAIEHHKWLRDLDTAEDDGYVDGHEGRSGDHE